MSYFNSPHIKIQLTRGYSAEVDSCDADLVALKWCALVSRKTVYAIRRVRLPNGKQTTQYLHRVILARMLGRDLLRSEEVDHIDHDGTNNRRDNLRLATRSQNAQNSRARSDNASGFKGVHWLKRKQKWRARIAVNGKYKELGIHATPEAAYAAYCEAAKELHGEFACTEAV